MPSPKESQTILVKEICRNGGLNINEAIDFVNENNLCFGGKGIIGVLIDKWDLGTIRYDETTQKFTKPAPDKG